MTFPPPSYITNVWTPSEHTSESHAHHHVPVLPTIRQYVESRHPSKPLASRQLAPKQPTSKQLAPKQLANASDHLLSLSPYAKTRKDCAWRKP